MLGGHVQVCDSCGATKTVYHSCRNRHCPKCQSLDQARWVAAQARDLLPVPYFHLVFTVPQALHPLFFADHRAGYQALFAAAMETVSDVARSRLGATPGAIAVLHTWTQTMRFHPHVHCIVTGGGLSLDRERWIGTRASFFLPVRVLSRVFRGKLLERFEAAVTSRSLSMSETFARQRLREAASTPWVVYSKAPMAGPDQVLRYLSRREHDSVSPPRQNPSPPPKTGGRSTRESPDVTRNCAWCATSATSESRTPSTRHPHRHRAAHELSGRTTRRRRLFRAGLRVRGALGTYDCSRLRHPIRLLHPRPWPPQVAPGGLLLPDRPLGAGRSAVTEAYNPPTD
jgi:hypothetical protein